MRRRGVLSVCLFSPLGRLKILSHTQRATEVKNYGVFFENAPFECYGVKRKRKSQ